MINIWISTFGSWYTETWDLVEWLERCASIPMITSSNPSSGSEFRSDLLLTARGGSTWALLVEFAFLPCYPGNTLCSQRLEPPGRVEIGAIQIPKFIFFYFFKHDKSREHVESESYITLSILPSAGSCWWCCVALDTERTRSIVSRTITAWDLQK
jgi:hypothetical protein